MEGGGGETVTERDMSEGSVSAGQHVRGEGARIQRRQREREKEREREREEKWKYKVK
jgi:hypothetical protein